VSGPSQCPRERGSSIERVDLEFLVGNNPLEPDVLALEFLEVLGVVGLEATVLLAPPVIGLLGDLQVLGDLGDVLAFGQQLVRLS